jgi:competence protein ComEA
MLVCIAVVAGVVWYRVGVGGADGAPPRRATPAATSAQLPARDAAAPSTTTAARDLIVVHVAGAVTRPGVVELDPGARVIDAVEAAGGAVPEADLDRLNLAAKVADGERILVSRVGDPPAADGTVPAAAGSSSPEPGSSQASGPINLNTATLEQLDSLPGIGPVLAQAILDERIRRGRFRSVQELREVRGIGEKRFADLADRVTV